MLDARTQFEIAHNLKLMQWSVQSQGAQFAVMIAPNKNTIYPEKMPQGYQPSRQDEQTQSNIDAFLQLMQANGISAADIKGILKDHKEEGLYYQRDSHWNKLGSLYGYNELMRSLGLEPQILPGQSLETKADHRGDLDEMLFPQGWMPEEDFYLLEQDVQYSPKLSQDELMNTWIETDCPQKHGSILMFRDSFGSNLVPYVAQSFQKAYFSRLEPYNLTRISSLQVQYVVIEKVERRIGQFAQQAPVMFMPTVSLPQSDSLAGPAESPAESIDVTVKESGDFLYFQAMLPEEQIQEKTQIYLRTTLEDGSSSTVPVFYLNQSPDALTKQTEPDKTMQHGFGVYLPKAGIEKAKIEVLVENDDEIISHPVNPVQEDESE